MKNLFLGFGLVAVGIVVMIIIAVVTIFVYKYLDKKNKRNSSPSDDPLCWHCDAPISNDAIFCDNCGGKRVKPKYKVSEEQEPYVWQY